MDGYIIPKSSIHVETYKGNERTYIDIDRIEGGSKTEFRYSVADEIWRRNLAYVNAHDRPVRPRESFYTRHGKRVLDVVLSGAAMIALLPVNGLLAAGTLMDVGRPILFHQERTGKDGRLFSIVKFRNMTNETDEKGELLPADQRVTKFGRFVRKTSLDELLNFWSILKGDMSIIGPRPLPEGYTVRLSERHRHRTCVRPGLECPVLSGGEFRSGWNQQFENDIYYVEHISLLLDIKMLLALVRMVFDRRSSSIRGGSNGGTFMGYDRDGECINSHRVPAEYISGGGVKIGKI